MLTRLLAPFIIIFKHRALIFRLSRREILSKYKGSIFGLSWSVIYPILMLGVYTFVFSIVFKARWDSVGSTPKGEFAIILFAGLIIFNFFVECITRSPNLIFENPSYVKKVIFPLEILSITAILTAFFQFIINFGILILFLVIYQNNINFSIILVPIVLFPLIFACIGMSWILASLGVFIRDVHQVIQVISQVLIFLCPVFYSVEMLPKMFRIIIYLNPLTYVINQFRDIVLWNTIPNINFLIMTWASSIIIFLSGFYWFRYTRKAFADIV